MSFSLIAISDVHLDSPSLLGADARNDLEQHKREAFKIAIDEAVSRNVSTFLICGDLYDERSVCFETLMFLRKCFLELSACDIKICYAHGKYDPSPTPNILHTPNLIEFSHETESYDINQPAAIPLAKVWGAGYSTNTSHIIGQYEKKSSDLPVVGMLYEENALSKQKAFILDELAGKNYDLFILAGYHSYLLAPDKSNILYLGSPTGTWFDEKPGGALHAQINDYGQVSLDKLTLTDVNWHDIEITDIIETDINAFIRRMEIEAQSAVSSVKNAFVRVRITGRCTFIDELTDETIERIAEKLSLTMDAKVYIEKDNLMPVLPKSILDNASPLVETMKIIDNIKSDDNKLKEFMNDTALGYDLFYGKLDDSKKKSFLRKIASGLVDTVCKVMIRETRNAN